MDLRLLLAVYVLNCSTTNHSADKRVYRMHAIIQSTLCARLLLRLRGAYSQLSDVTSFSVSTIRGKASNSEQPADVVRRRFHEIDTMSDEYIAMDELSNDEYGHPLG